MMERCNKADKGFECLKLIGHRGGCQCVTSEAFNASMQSAENAFLYGDEAKCTCGRRTPFPHCHATACPIYSPESKGVCGKKAECMVLDYIGNKPDPQDELGRVWDVLHANGIESAGELSASEAVKQLFTTRVIAPQPYRAKEQIVIKWVSPDGLLYDSYEAAMANEQRKDLEALAKEFRYSSGEYEEGEFIDALLENYELVRK